MLLQGLLQICNTKLYFRQYQSCEGTSTPVLPSVAPSVTSFTSPSQEHWSPISALASQADLTHSLACPAGPALSLCVCVEVTMLLGGTPCFLSLTLAWVLVVSVAHASTAVTLISWLAAIHSCYCSSINAFTLLHSVYTNICPPWYMNAWDIAGYISNHTEQDLSVDFNVSVFIFIFPISCKILN